MGVKGVPCAHVEHVYSSPPFIFLFCRNERMELEETPDMWIQVCVDFLAVEH